MGVTPWSCPTTAGGSFGRAVAALDALPSIARA